MKLSTRYQAWGLLRILRGSAIVFAGKISSNRTMGVRGRLDCLTGRLQRNIGKVQGFCGL